MIKIDRKRLKQLLSEDKSPEVILLLLKLTESKNAQLHNDLIIISSQLRELEGKSRTGITYIAEAHTQKAKITHSVLSIIDNLTEEDLESDIVWTVAKDSTKGILQSENSNIKASLQTKKENENSTHTNSNKWIKPIIIGALILGLILYITLQGKPQEDIIPITQSATNNTKLEDKLDTEKKDKEIIKALINSWNHANEYKNVTILSQLYAEDIEDFYGKLNVTKEYCVTDQTDFFAKYPESHQSIIGDIDFVKIDNSNYVCYFNKEVIKNEDAKTYRGILKFQKQLGDFKIVAETTMKYK